MVMRVKVSPAREPNGLEPPVPPSAPIRPPPLPRWISTSRIKNRPRMIKKKFNGPASQGQKASTVTVRSLSHRMGKPHGLERHYTRRGAGREDGFAHRNGTAGGRHLANQSWRALTLISRCRRAAHASTAAWAAASVVMHVTPWATAAARIL